VRRELDEGQRRTLDALRRWSRFSDSIFRVPGTGVRFGWDPIIGLVPWLGDVVPAIFSGLLILHAFRFGVPRVIQLRMATNVAIDLAVGAVPLLGDLFDVAWKANAKNLALLERHAERGDQPTPGDYAFVTAVITVALLCAVVPALLLLWLLQALGRPLV
jgi:hypothetical protein